MFDCLFNQLINHIFCLELDQLIGTSKRANGNEDESDNSKIGCGRRSLYLWGLFCSQRPLLVIFIAIALTIVLACGLTQFDVQSNPLELWSSPKAQGRQEKKFFDENFGPFYRVQQIIISLKNPESKPVIKHNNITYTALFNVAYFKMLLELEKNITSLIGSDKTTKLSDVCFKPVKNCAVQTPLNYFQSNETALDYAISQNKYLDHVTVCAKTPFSMSDKIGNEIFGCLGGYGGPGLPNVVFAGYEGDNYFSATSFAMTFIVNNHDEKDPMLKKAMAWEQSFLEEVARFASHHADDLNVAYYSERSVQDELDRQSQASAITVVVSYLVMFIYVAIALGRWRKNRVSLLIESKVTVGLAGVTIVIMSVAAALGAWSYGGGSVSMLIVEVLPFLVLAVGVDNIFLLVQALQRQSTLHSGSRSVNCDERMAMLLSKVGPTLLLASCAEVACFLLGAALASMPAVRTFAINAALALIVSLLLQLTVFISVLAMDLKRQAMRKSDIFCCFKFDEDTEDRIDTNIPSDEVTGQQRDKSPLHWLFSEEIAPALMLDYVRGPILVIFFGWTLFSASTLAPAIEVGLDQRLSMPDDSYVLNYFNAQIEQLRVGAPFYIVVSTTDRSPINFTSWDIQDMISSSSTSSQYSLGNQVSQLMRENTSHIANTPLTNWIDQYGEWAKSKCCFVYKGTNTLCPTEVVNRTRICTKCNIIDIDTHLIKPNAFLKYLPLFLEDIPTTACPNAGHAAFGSSIRFSNSNKTGSVLASNFQGYHRPLGNSSSFIAALKETRQMSSSIEASLKSSIPKARVFTYSMFYVFYEQYLNMWKQTIIALVASLGAIFMISVLCRLGFVNSLIVMISLAMILINLLGLMQLTDVSLNALSLVNLVMGAGISVEFLAHIAYAFAHDTRGDRVTRAREALAETGSSVLAGITLTKLAGVSVLALAASRIFQGILLFHYWIVTYDISFCLVFYFRMYAAIVGVGALHGLILLPILLSMMGGKQKTTVVLRDPEMSSTNNVIAKRHGERPEPEGRERDVTDGLVSHISDQ